MAGKISADNNSLESIKDVTDIYSSYYGNFFSKIELKDKRMFSVAAIVAFVRTIYLDYLNNFEDIITICDMTIDDFKNMLYQIHNIEIIDIYKEKAVQFADQCLSNYLLYYIFIEKKWIKLSKIIRYTFKVNKNQTINSINVLTTLFINENNQDYLFSEVKELWNELSKEDPLFFWEYVKVFYKANPTEALLLIKERIESTSSINVQEIDLKINDKNNLIEDDILTIIGGFANDINLEIALDLYFLYYQKRPDLISQFYYTAINNFGINSESYRFNYYSPQKLIEKIIYESNDWKNIYVNRLFVLIAKHFLKLHFDGVESMSQNRAIFYQLELENSDSVNTYREMIWNGLIDMYSKSIEIKYIEDIVYNYGQPSSEKSKTVLENDYPFLMKLLTLFRNKESYFFAKS